MQCEVCILKESSEHIMVEFYYKETLQSFTWKQLSVCLYTGKLLNILLE